FSSRRRHTRFKCDWSPDVCSSDLRLRSMRSLLAADAVHRPARCLPRVVRGARAEVDLVRDDVRVAADLFRALRVAEEVRVVLLQIGRASCRQGGVVAVWGRAWWLW